MMVVEKKKNRLCFHKNLTPLSLVNHLRTTFRFAKREGLGGELLEKSRLHGFDFTYTMRLPSPLIHRIKYAECIKSQKIILMYRSWNQNST